MLPGSMKAIVTTGDGGLELMDIAVPHIEPDEILVKVFSAAQNPTDCEPICVNRKISN